MRWVACLLWLLPAVALAKEPPPMRFFPVAAFDGEGDFVQSGVRISRGPDGAVRVARERFEPGGVPRGLSVPRALGGGYLFYQPLGSSGSAGTALFRAADWTGPLVPLGTAPFVVSTVRAGFDRFYLLGSGRAIAIDPESGAHLPLDPLPQVATLLDLFFFESGKAFLRAPIVGMLSTKDSGLSWQELPVDDAQEELPLLESAPSLLPRHGRLLNSVVVRGASLEDGTIFALVEGERVSFDPERGTLARSPELGLDPRLLCQALPPGELSRADAARSDQLWFACQGAHGGLELRAYGVKASARASAADAAASLVLEVRFVTPPGASVLAAGRLGVLLHGACAGDAAPPKGKRRLCLVGRSSRRVLLAPMRSGAGLPETFAVGSAAVSRVSLLPDGGIQTERLDAPAKKTVHRVHHESEIEALVLGGTWLPGATVFEEGISFWATRGASYVGVRLEKGGDAARVGAIQRPLRRAFLSGKRALAWGASGFARVSVDSGMTFAEVNYPFTSGDQDPNGLTSVEQALELGCGPAGCSLGTWLSVGWGPPAIREVEAAPPLIAVPPPGGGRFRFACTPTGENSLPGLPSRDRAQSGDDPAALVVPPPFWERPAPVPGPLEVAYSVGDPRGLARVYALGPKEGGWGNRGRVTVSFRSRFATGTGLSSLLTGDLFVDVPEVQSRLAALDRVSQSAQTELDPSGEGGVMLIRSRQESMLLAFAERSHVQRFDVAEGQGLLSISGAVLSRGRWFVGQSLGGDFRILELRDGGLVEFASFPLGETGPREAMLVRSTAGDLGISIEGDSGLLVYPVAESGALGDALFQRFRGARPPQCPATALGYLVVQELSIAPYVEVGGGELDVSRVTMRRVVGFGPECIDALAADAREAFAPRLARASGNASGGTPLVVTDRTETGRRVAFSCR